MVSYGFPMVFLWFFHFYVGFSMTSTPSLWSLAQQPRQQCDQRHLPPVCPQALPCVLESLGEIQPKGQKDHLQTFTSHWNIIYSKMAKFEDDPILIYRVSFIFKLSHRIFEYTIVIHNSSYSKKRTIQYLTGHFRNRFIGGTYHLYPYLRPIFQA